jgi:tRNA-splicing ligase RtcB
VRTVKLAQGVFEIPPTEKEGMLVPARILASDELFASMDEGVFRQVTNVACLPGIVEHALCMPDGHWGYGFPIGGVAAFDVDTGVISPGGIGFDINCGMRLLRTNLTLDDVQPKLERLMTRLFELVPSGVGTKGFVRLDADRFCEAVTGGSGWCVRNGYGREEDLERLEERGCIAGADVDALSPRAISRGREQLGTLGSGNHYLEVQVVRPRNVFNVGAARRFGLDLEDQIVVMLHCGSRGFGHQVGTDYLRVFQDVMKRYGIRTHDRELACAPFASPEGRQYFGAMAAAANCAFANRQIITHQIRRAFADVFGRDDHELGLELVYDVAHNIAKVEEYDVGGTRRKLLVHRKGATRSFGGNREDVPLAYRDVGQPVIVGGSMETGSFLLLGSDHPDIQTFGSTLHGSGRTMSRQAAKKRIRGDKLQRDMAHRGIVVKSASLAGLAEEAGFAYKNINEVVDVVHELNISRKVARLEPIGNVKG